MKRLGDWLTSGRAETRGLHLSEDLVSVTRKLPASHVAKRIGIAEYARDFPLEAVMIAKVYLRLATTLVNSAVFVMAGGAYDESATTVSTNGAPQGGLGDKVADRAATAWDRNPQEENSSGADNAEHS